MYQVWSTDITYIKIAGGMVYMAAIIDWHSKEALNADIICGSAFAIHRYCNTQIF
jgi:hypothetical protein